jgi:PadR family transcriptional regulator, regulatory protein PadR
VAASLTDFELLVVLAALRLGKDAAYTVSIAEDIRTRTGRNVSRANVFTSVRRLEDRGLLETKLGEALVERGGRPPRLVRVTSKGAAAAFSTAAAIQAMIGDLVPVRAK